MPLHLFRKTCLLVLVASASLLAVPAKAQTWDLRTDWSNTDNPNGVWRYLVNGATATASTRGADRRIDVVPAALSHRGRRLLRQQVGGIRNIRKGVASRKREHDTYPPSYSVRSVTVWPGVNAR